MLARAIFVGVVNGMGEIKITRNGNSVALISIDINGETYPCILQGKLLSLIQNETLKLKDIVYVEAKISQDNTFAVTSAKCACVYYASFLNVVRASA